MAGKIVLLDSSIVIELQRGNQAIINKIYEFKQENIYVTPVVIAEFYRGARDRRTGQMPC